MVDWYPYFCNLVQSFTKACVYFPCSVGDALQEQYELVYKAVLELFKRQMDVIRDRHSGTEVNFELDVLLIFKKMFDLVRGS